MEPSWRKPAGIIGLLIYISAYALIVTSFGEALSRLPTALTVIAYMLFGVAWIVPLKPLFLWMNTGRWTAPPKPKADK